MDNPHASARRLLVSCLVDFVGHLSKRRDPLIVGGGYQTEGLVKEFEVWAASRKVNITELDMDRWENLWRSGLLK